MKLDDFLASSFGGLRGAALVADCERRPFPGNGGTREELLRALEDMDARTRDTLDMLGLKFQGATSALRLSPEEEYMDAQRTLCFLDFLSRLADSSHPGISFRPGMRKTAEWRNGVWREFGPFWLQNAAWQLANGLDVFGDGKP